MPKTFNPEILKQVRNQMNLTQAAFAGMISPKLQRQNIHAWEKGVSVPSIKNLSAICEAFGLQMDDLFKE